ncbi:MAG: MFS transporter, partial [Bacteroidetes bacterium]
MKLTEATKLRVLYFLVFSCTASWLPIFADYLKDRGLTGIEISTVLSVTPLMMFVMQPVFGYLSDKFGYKKALLVATLFAALSYVLYLAEGNFVSYLLITACMSLFYNSTQPLLDSLSLQLVQKDPTFSYGSLRVAGAAGWACTGTVTGYFIDQINIAVIFIFSAATMFLAFICTFSLAGDANVSDSAGEKKKHSVVDVLQNRDLLFLLFCVFLISTGGTTIW